MKKKKTYLIYWNKRVGKYQVSLRRQGKAIHAGYFSHLSDAVVARNKLLKDLRALPFRPSKKIAPESKTRESKPKEVEMNQDDLRLLKMAQGFRDDSGNKPLSGNKK